MFDGESITLQAVRTCQQVFSAAFIGYLEHACSSDEEKNQLSTPVPHPDTDIDWLRSSLGSTLNGIAWSQNPGVQEWLGNNRLNFMAHFSDKNNSSAKQLQEVAMQSAELTLPAITRLEELLALSE